MRCTGGACQCRGRPHIDRHLSSADGEIPMGARGLDRLITLRLGDKVANESQYCHTLRELRQ